MPNGGWIWLWKIKLRAWWSCSHVRRALTQLWGFPITGVTDSPLVSSKLFQLSSRGGYFQRLAATPWGWGLSRGRHFLESNVSRCKNRSKSFTDDEALYSSSEFMRWVFSLPFQYGCDWEFTLYKGNLPANFRWASRIGFGYQMKEGDMQGLGTGKESELLTPDFYLKHPSLKNKVSVDYGGRISNTNWAMNQAQDFGLFRIA